MKRKRGAGVILRNVLLILMLAVLCIGGVELAVCSRADPALFAQLTAPVRQTAQQVGDWFAATWSSMTAGFTELKTRALERVAVAETPEPTEPVQVALSGAAQIAGTPAIQMEFVPVDPAITELVRTVRGEYLLGGNVLLPYFNQADEPWAECPFGVDPVGTHGCGPTALAMAVSGLTERTVDPREMAAWTGEAGYSAPHSGAYLSIVEGVAAHYGLRCTSVLPENGEELCAALSGGGIMVALMGPGHFTRSGHFILLHGVTLSGQILVADPYSRENSLMTWDPDLLVQELSYSRSDGAPLWLLTKDQSLF